MSKIIVVGKKQTQLTLYHAEKNYNNNLCCTKMFLPLFQSTSPLFYLLVTNSDIQNSDKC